MKRTKTNKVILLESSNAPLWRIIKRYGKIYIYSGNFFHAERLPCDFLTMADFGMSEYKAGQVIDWLCGRYIKSSEAKVLNSIMNDERAHLIIKQIFTDRLGKLFFSFILAEKFIEKYEIREPIDFIPCEFSYTLYNIISERKDLLPAKVNIPLWYLNKMKRRELIKNSIYRLAFTLYPLCLALLMHVGRSVNKRDNDYRYGVYIWDGWVNSYSFPYRIDFLESEAGVSPNNTLYVIDKQMSKANFKKVKTNGYPCCFFKEMVNKFSVWEYFKKIYPCVRKIAKKMISIKSNRMLLTEAYLKTLRWFILWEIFYAHNNVRTFIAVQDPGSVIRVLLQNRHGSRNIYIYLSTTFDAVYRQNINAFIELYYGFLIFDSVISSYMSNIYIKKNNNIVGRYIDSGILRSDIVFQVNHDSKLKRKIKQELGIPADKIVIGFFDTSIGRMGVFDNQEGCSMLNDVYRILQSNDEYYIIYNLVRRNGIEKDSDAQKRIGALIAHKRVIYLNKFNNSAYRYRSQHFMGVCDLVIGAFTSSAPHESVAGGIKTVCYIPSQRFDKEVFVLSTVPRFCARGYEQLKEYVEYWLHRCSEDEFRNFQDTYIKKYVDSHCDGRATQRLQTILEQY